MSISNRDYVDMVKEFHADLLVTLARKDFPEHDMLKVVRDALVGLKTLLTKRNELVFSDDMPIDLYTTLVLTYTKNLPPQEIVPTASKQVETFIETNYNI